MEDTNYAIKIILVMLYLYLVYYIITWYLSRRNIAYEGSGRCGERPSSPSKYNKEKITENDVTAKDKACIAVGICDDFETLGFSLLPEYKHKWKSLIIKNADKIFPKNASVPKKKKTSKRK